MFRIGHDGDRDLVEVLRILHDARWMRHATCRRSRGLRAGHEPPWCLSCLLVVQPPAEQAASGPGSCSPPSAERALALPHAASSQDRAAVRAKGRALSQPARP
jgi:hypothetical protein